MDSTSGRGQTDVAPVIPPDGPGPDSRWSLAGAEPKRLALRLVAAALGVGIVGGMATAGLSVLFARESDISPAARILAIGLPLVLVALIGWHLAAVTGHVGSSPSGRSLGWVAAAGVALTTAVQAWPEVAGLDGDDLAHNAGVTLMVLIYGALFGLAVAAAATVVWVPTLLLLRASQVRITLPAAQFVQTAFAMAVTAAFTLWVTTEMRTEIVTGIATALAGTGAVLTARWCLGDRQA